MFLFGSLPFFCGPDKQYQPDVEVMFWAIVSTGVKKQTARQGFNEQDQTYH